MTRPLVLTNEAARHWLRQIMPPPRLDPIGPQPMSDRKLFLLTFCAAFLAFSGFIA
ncbi:MAG: hypothetical protein ACKVOP_01805 [Sphingomonadaceae bacterium]